MRVIAQKYRYNIALIRTPFPSYTKKSPINLIRIFEELFNEIYIITGNIPDTSSKKIHIIEVIRDTKEEPLLVEIFKHVLTQLRVSFNLLKISRKIDIVLFSSGTMSYSLPLLTGKLLRKRVILIVTESASRSVERGYSKRAYGAGILFSRIFRVLEKINYALADQIVVYSKSLVNWFGLSRYEKKVFTNGARFVDIDIFKRTKGLEERRDLVGYIGRLSEDKGITNFVKAIPMVRETEFLVCGDGPLFDKLKKVEEKEAYSRVEITGWVPYEKIPGYLNELKLLVIPSYTEGLPRIVLQAMACGTPVLATSVGALPDIIKDEKTGFLLEDNNPESIAIGIKRVLAHQRLDEITKNAEVLIRKEYIYTKALERYRGIMG